MFHHILSHRGIIAAFVFCVLVVGGSQFYYWHVRRSTQDDLARTQRFIRQLQIGKQGHKTGQDADPVDAEIRSQDSTNYDADVLQAKPDRNSTEESTDKISDGIDAADMFNPNDSTSAEENDKVSVSPFGFGPYPDVPQGFPMNIRVPWLWSQETFDHVSIEILTNLELAARVLIKLWNQGDTFFTGVSIDSNRVVYPHYPSTAYVTYRDITREDGTVFRVIGEVFGGPDLPDITDEMMLTGEIPGVHLIDAEEEGIDALQFLNIK